MALTAPPAAAGRGHERLGPDKGNLRELLGQIRRLGGLDISR